MLNNAQAYHDNSIHVPTGIDATAAHHARCHPSEKPHSTNDPAPIPAMTSKSRRTDNTRCSVAPDASVDITTGSTSPKSTGHAIPITRIQPRTGPTTPTHHDGDDPSGTQRCPFHRQPLAPGCG